jgi:N utilization substance protein B
MTRRTKAREVALQLLFQHDQNGVPVPRRAVTRFVADRLDDDDAEEFALTLYDGVIKHQAAIDEVLTKTAEKWRLSRMMPVDRNVLRIGTFELLHSPERAATAVVLNEAIEMARRYATADSPGFVNGVLDKVAQSRPGGEEPTPA